MTSVILRRTTIFGTPIALGTLAAIHPMMPGDNLGIWNLIHTLQIPLAALLGISVILLLRSNGSRIAHAARLAVVPWVAFFAAYDGVAGLATGALTGFTHEHPETSQTVTSAASAMTDALFLGAVLPLGAVLFALGVFGGAAVALQRTGVSVLAAVAIAIGGIVWTLVHPLIGAPAMLVFFAGAAIVELSARAEARAPMTPAAEIAQ
jgi:hypothetical protein